MNYGILNLASLIMGLVAWCVPIICIFKNKYNAVSSIGSFTSCVLALLMQIIYQWHLVDIEDWWALIDTTWAVVLASAVLIILTVAINIFCAAYSRKAT